MARKKKKKKPAVRTISAEQQEKMQTARKTVAVHRKRMEMIRDAGLDVKPQMTGTERMLNGVRRK